jgi:hypothetical protein
VQRHAQPRLAMQLEHARQQRPLSGERTGPRAICQKGAFRPGYFGSGPG